MTPRELRAIEDRIASMRQERLNSVPPGKLAGEVRGPGLSDEQRAGRRSVIREARKEATLQRVLTVLPLIESGAGAKAVSERLAISIDRARHVVAEARRSMRYAGGSK